MGLPVDWHIQLMEAIKKAQKTDPTRAVFGISLPESWKSHLTYYVRNGELRRLFGITAFTFAGNEIKALYPPSKEEATK